VTRKEKIAALRQLKKNRRLGWDGVAKLLQLSVHSHTLSNWTSVSHMEPPEEVAVKAVALLKQDEEDEEEGMEAKTAMGPFVDPECEPRPPSQKKKSARATPRQKTFTAPGELRAISAQLSKLADQWEVILATLDRAFFGQASAGESPSPGKTMDEATRDAVVSALGRTRGNRSEAAKLLKVGERTMYRKIKKYGLENYGSMAQ